MSDSGQLPSLESSFAEVVALIQRSRQRAYRVLNTALVELYWKVGEYINHKLETAAWGDGVVDQLGGYIARKYPEIKGFTRSNLFRMRQFFETYQEDERLVPLVKQLPWTHNLLILSRCKRR